MSFVTIAGAIHSREHASTIKRTFSMEPRALLTSSKNDGGILHAARGFFLGLFLTKSEPANTARVDLTSATTKNLLHVATSTSLYTHPKKSLFK